MFDYFPFLTFVTISAFTPGPNNCMALAYATRGFRNGMTFSFGVFGGMLLVMLACGLCSSLLTQHIDGAEQFMRIAGAAYMTWLAWSLWQAAGLPEKATPAEEGLLFKGCALQLINPKIIVYGLTAYSVFILPVFSDVPRLVLFAAFLAFVGFLGTLTWAFSGSLLESAFRRHPGPINRTLALLVLACAVSMVI